MFFIMITPASTLLSSGCIKWWFCFVSLREFQIPADACVYNLLSRCHFPIRPQHITSMLSALTGFMCPFVLPEPKPSTQNRARESHYEHDIPQRQPQRYHFTYPADADLHSSTLFCFRKHGQAITSAAF